MLSPDTKVLAECLKSCLDFLESMRPLIYAQGDVDLTCRYAVALSDARFGLKLIGDDTVESQAAALAGHNTVTTKVV